MKALFAAMIAFVVSLSCPALAQKFPDKPVKVILPYPVGTGPDMVMRRVGEKLSRWWGQPVIVENRPGGNGWIAVTAAKRSAPDGYTLLQADTLLFGLQPHLYRRLPFDPVKDFDPVAPMYRTPFFVVVNSNSGWKSMADLIAAAKAKGGALTYGSSGIGSQAHLGAEMLEQSAGVKMTHIPYKDTPLMYTAIANGELGWAFGTALSAGPLLQAHKVKLLALAAPKRHPSFPDVPTIAESGGPRDVEMKTWIALFAPHGTPKSIVEKINGDVARAMAEPDVREFLTPVAFSAWSAPPAELAKTVEDDLKQYGEVAKRVQISLD
ncbi:Bug family tripartite tricarboxylate transporter substrate binding protein [Cupriavidus necator]|nr:tripartite tricarboxylate transporter substrate binding protein [Cupriavidus necator]